MRSRLLPVLALLLPLAATPCRAQTPTEIVVLAVTLNGEAKGEFFVRASADGDYLVRETDMRGWNLKLPDSERLVIDGERYLSLRALPAIKFRYDEANQTLALEVPSELLPRTAIDLSAQRPQRVLRATPTSGYWNYRFEYNGSNTAVEDALSLNSELALRWRRYLLFTDSFHGLSGADRRDVRLMTNITLDRPQRIERTIVGDFLTSSGELGALNNLGGVSFAKSSDLDPYLVRQPTLALSGAARTASTVEVYLDGVPVRSERVAPGEFELANLSYYGGARSVDVVVKDAFGRAERFSLPYYFTDQLLRDGLHDFSYNLGLARENFTVRSNDYGDAVFTGFHRYGFSDNFTAGLRWESSLDRGNLGPSASLRIRRGGVLNATLAGSFDREQSSNGGALSLSHSYQTGWLNTQALLRGFSRDYAFALPAPIGARPKSDALIGFNAGGPTFGNLGFSLSRLENYDGELRRAATLSYSRTLFGKLNAFASAARVSGTRPGTEAFLGLSYLSGNDYTLNALHQRRVDASTLDLLQAGKNLPVGEGLGYRVSLERERSAAQRTESITPQVQYNAKYATLGAEFQAISPSNGAQQEFYRLSVAGAAAFIGRQFGALRAIDDAFALVRLPGPRAVRVSQNNQVIGRTNSKGLTWVPNLASYTDNQIAINDQDVPLNYTLENRAYFVAPAYRSGMVVEFNAAKIQAISGRLKLERAGVQRAVEFIEVQAQLPGGAIAFPTGRDGEFYLENVAPGSYSASFNADGELCTFALKVPASDEMQIELGDVICALAR